MKVKQVINNNFVVVQGDEEMILLGRGIGFNAKVGDAIDSEEVSKVFYSTNHDTYTKIRELLLEIPSDIIDISTHIIGNIKLEIGKKVNDVLYINLIDHINSALKRYKEGIKIKNNLLFEIKLFYPEEFQLGKKALDYINDAFAVELPEDEAGFISLHIVNATINDSANNMGARVTKLIKEILSIVSRYYSVSFNSESLYYYRFVTHIRFFGQRMFSGDVTENEADSYNLLLQTAREKYQSSYNCAQKIVEFLMNQYGVVIGSEEVLYLTIHIQRIVDEQSKEK